MKSLFLRIIFCGVLSLGAISYGAVPFHISTPASEEGAYVTFDEIKDYINKRGFIETRKKEGVLKIFGDVRARWLFIKEDVDPSLVLPAPPQPGKKPLPDHRYRSEVTLHFDYRAPCNWMVSKMKWASYAGGENSSGKVDIDRAFIGYRLFQNPEIKSDCFVEIGRTGLGDLFESEVEFSSQFDGIHLYYSRKICPENAMTFVIHGGPFVVNLSNKHYAWVAEAALNNIPGNFSIKYNLIDWNSFKPDPAISNNPGILKKYEYLVGQCVIGNRTPLVWFNGKEKPLFVYAAFLNNFLAKASKTTLDSRQNHAWYVGGTLGCVRKAGDWSLTLRYEVVEALAIPEIDVSGVGKANSLSGWLAEAIANGYDPKDANGFTNYKGVYGMYVYGITNSLSFKACAAYSRPKESRIGSDFTYRKFEAGVISSF